MTAPLPPESDPVAALRPRYQADLAAGTDRFFEPRRTTCPWCGGTRLKTRLRTPDLVQHKPGTFVLDKCQDCTHIFQNPRLSGDGLEFYYRDLYDGLGEKRMSQAFEGNNDGLRSRAELMAAHYRPKRWLDVGTGHGHFCREAAAVLPETEFDGLDMSDGVEIAQANGWIATAHRGNFVELTEQLSGTYDAISMYHYLEHTLDPKAELAAAAEVLSTGGHLEIELPDPESRWARPLGRYWVPWLQPQHLHLMPIANLCAAAEEVGFTVVEQQRGEPHMPIDLVGAVLLWSDRWFGNTDVPWEATSPGKVRRWRHRFGVLLTIPLVLVAAAGDKLFAPIGRKRGFSNAYRVLLVRT